VANIPNGEETFLKFQPTEYGVQELQTDRRQTDLR